MKGLLVLSWKHARFHYWRTLLLVLSLGLGFSIPLATRWMTAELQQTLERRAQATPMLAGHPGSRIDLVIGGLYFRTELLRTIPFGLLDEFSQDQLTEPVPLHLSHHASSWPVVGTSLDYFSRRNLTLQSGTLPRRLGDCLLGADVALQLQLQPGDRLLSDSTGFLNPASQLPLKMRVTGILLPSYSPDDRAIFVDIKTAWLMDGIGHGHMQEKQASKEQVLQQNDRSVTLGANVQNFMEVTDDNLQSFHFHGRRSEFPLHAILLFPTSNRNGIIWEGRFQNRSDIQIVHPLAVVQELISMLINIRHLVDAIVLVLGAVMLGLLLLLGSLSLQLRKREMDTFHAIGASKSIRAWLITIDFLLIFILSVPVTFLLSWIFAMIGKPLLFQLLV